MNFLIFTLAVFTQTYAFQPEIALGRSIPKARSSMFMKWTFDKGMGGSMRDLGAIGSEGEYFFHPNKAATLKGPEGVLIGKPKVVPIFPYNNVLIPLGKDWLNLLEMRHRQLFSDVGDGVFGFTYYSQQQQKLALVGTLARVTERKVMEDGRCVVVIEGFERFYIQDIISEKPYIKARVQSFRDCTENVNNLERLEMAVFDEVRANAKFMEMLFPAKNYSISSNILKYRPSLPVEGTRQFSLVEPTAELQRRSQFSFAVLDMLQVTPGMRLALLQEHILERRYSQFIKVLESGGGYLKKELVSRGVATEENIQQLKKDILKADESDYVSPSSWYPENFVDGQWVQRPTLM